VLLAKEPRQIPTPLASRPATIHLRENAQTQRSEYHNAPSDAYVLPKTIVENTGLIGSMPMLAKQKDTKKILFNRDRTELGSRVY
jgi:hypothetical protein